MPCRGFRENADDQATKQSRAVLISPEDLESPEETLAILSDARELAALREGISDLEEGRMENLEQLKRDARP